MKIDNAMLESQKTEIHKYDSYMISSENVLFFPRLSIGRMEGFNRSLDADLFINKNESNKPRPAIVFLHGGCWRLGSPNQFYFYSNYLTEKYNFVSLNVDYRMSAEAKFPAAIADAKCGIKWLRSMKDKLNIDCNRIVVCGGSSGANLASLVATTSGIKEYEGDYGYDGYSSECNAAVLFNGEFDMWDLIEKGSLITAMNEFLGGTPDEIPHRYDEISSIKRIDKNTCPTLLLHGTEDNCVSHQQSLAYYNKLKENGVYAEIEIYEGKQHAWFNIEPDLSIALKRVEEFLVKVINLEKI